MKQHSFKTRVVLFVLLMLSLMLLNSIFGLVWPLMQVQAGPTLPPRDEPSSPPPDRDVGDGDVGDGDVGDGGGPLLAYIELFVTPAPVGVESVVQWQDVNGDWNDVEGWKRELQNGYERWTVEAKDFNTGPFRWQVRRGLTGPVLGSSEPFTLPAGANQTVRVTVVLQ